MADYKRLKIFIGGFLIVYFVVGFFTRYIPKGEIFPFFSWRLFQSIPNTIVEYGVMISIYNGKPFQPPRLFQDAKGIIPQSDSINAREIIQNLGRAHAKNQIEKRENLRKLFEKNFLKLPARYQLIRMRYNPIQKWKSGESQTQYLQIFTAGEYQL